MVMVYFECLQLVLVGTSECRQWCLRIRFPFHAASVVR